MSGSHPPHPPPEYLTMKPWHVFTLLLGAMIVVPLFSQTTSSSLVSFNFPQKILGKPAGRDWIEIPLDPSPGVTATYVVPADKVLCLSCWRAYPSQTSIGSPDVTLTRDGQIIHRATYELQASSKQINDLPLIQLSPESDGYWDTRYQGQPQTPRMLTAHTGSQLTMTWEDDNARSFSLVLCGWLEDA